MAERRAKRKNFVGNQFFSAHRACKNRGICDLNPKPKRRGKPQISQISQMTETKEFGVIRRKNASGTKM